jgi:hypothetical protein
MSVNFQLQLFLALVIMALSPFNYYGLREVAQIGCYQFIPLSVYMGDC